MIYCNLNEGGPFIDTRKQNIQLPQEFCTKHIIRLLTLTTGHLLICQSVASRGDWAVSQDTDVFVPVGVLLMTSLNVALYNFHPNEIE